MYKRTIEDLRQAAAKYSTRTELARKDQATYRAIKRRGLLDELTPHMPTPKRYTLAELREIAAGFSSRTEWMEQHPSSFQAAHRMGVVEDIAPKTRRGSG